MPNRLISFLSRLKTSPRVLVVALPVVIGGLASISWSFPETCACIPQKAQQQIRQIQTLNRLHQEMYPQKGIVSTSLVQLNHGLDRQERLPSDSNFYKLSVRMTKKVVLNYGKSKLATLDPINGGTVTSPDVKKNSQFPPLLSIVTRLDRNHRDRDN